ncbi:MAG: hypothetical protein SOT60_05100 [Bilifractor sp.]|nr:hypothetical protein [Bilifractor sp.]
MAACYLTVAAGRRSVRSRSFFYANREPQPNAKESCAAGVAIAR